MDFKDFKRYIFNCASGNFVDSTEKLQNLIFALNKKELLSLIVDIGAIPEDIGHDSSEEKLYTKASDILFAKALMEMGLEAKVLTQRADCADIIAQSKYHKYSLVGDAKSIRLSRTAKNAKDFKVNSMVHWRGDCDYSVLMHPYFQYPKSNSQIYQDALNGNVCLFAWEYLYIMLKEGIRETQTASLSKYWNQSQIIASETLVSNNKKCFLPQQNINIQKLLKITPELFDKYFSEVIKMLIARGELEIKYWESEIDRVKNLDREDAINELLKSMKLDGKIATIQQFLKQIQK